MKTIPPDEHLRQALRHAPDGDVSPPAELSAQILAAAHRSAATRPAAPAEEASDWRRWLAAWWHRPGASAALASLVLVGFIGLLWRGETPGPATDEGPARASPATARKAAVDSATPATVDLVKAAKPPLPLAPETPRQSTSESSAAAARPRAPTEAATATQAAKTQAGATTRTTAVPATASPTAPRAAINATAETSAMPRPQPAEISPVVADLPKAADGAVQQAARSAPVAAAVPLTVSGAPAAGASLLKAAQPVAEAGSRPALPGQENAVGGQQWHWQPPGAWRDPDAAWWAALARLAQGRWQAVGDAQPAADSLQLQGQRGAENLGRLWLEPASLLWCGPTPPCQRAPLPPEVRRELLEPLAR